MRRFLLLITFLFLLHSARTQVILNELYTNPDVTPQYTNNEFFELYNTSRTTPINLDCYSLIVYYDTRSSAGKPGKTGFYVLDFPDLSIGPLGYFEGAAANPYQVQKCKSLTPDFNWNDLKGKYNNSGILLNYELNSNGTGYNIIGDWINSNDKALTLDDLLTSNKNNTTNDPTNLADGFVYAIFLFNNGNYVNGFLGGCNTQAVSSVITNMPPLPYTSNCSSTPHRQIDWKQIKRAENVTETPGSDNGYIRVRDGKCGEWEKSSSPQKNSTTGQCTYTGHEHTPGLPNGGGKVPMNDGFTITVQTSVCGTRIDFAITDVKDRGNLKAPNMFPFAVELYLDANKDGLLDIGDQYLATTTDSIYKIGPSFFEFEPLSSSNQYLLVFKSALGCVEKIVPTDPYTFQATEKNYCGSQIDFSATSNFNLTDDFRVDVYWDANNDGKIDTYYDQLIKSITNVSSGTLNLPAGFADKKLLIEYTANYSSATPCNMIVRPVPAPVITGLTTAQIYICGDANGDVVTYDVQGITGDATGAFPISIELWLDANGDGIVDGSTPLATKTDLTIEEPSDQFVVQAGGKPLILVYRTARGCAVSERILQNCGALPVNLGSFTAMRNRQKVLLKWETLTEQVNRGFYVQRNVKGSWENRAFVFSAADGGNSNKPLDYTYNDENNEKGVSQYRIQQVDMDGKVSYSPIRSVRGDGQAARTLVYPNPSDIGKFNVVFEDEGARNVIVSDVNGRIVRQYRKVVNNLVVDGLEAGMYLVQITDLSSAETSTEKVIIKKR